MSLLFFEDILSKIGGKKKILSLEDFQVNLDEIIAEIEHKYEKSRELMDNFQTKYDEKLSILDFEGSKKAVDQSRQQLAESLEYDSQLEFLKTIRQMTNYFDKEMLKITKKMNEFQELANQIFDLKKINSLSNRRIFLKRFNKFILSSTDVLMAETVSHSKVSDNNVEEILQEAQNKIITKDSLGNEAEKIIEEIRKKIDTK
ncbi:MAG: hypothetical protein ACFFAJ_17470 [Candidatus Hodarchaeota archaeon]